jgi:hypothetical protein
MGVDVAVGEEVAVGASSYVAVVEEVGEWLGVEVDVAVAVAVGVGLFNGAGGSVGAADSIVDVGVVVALGVAVDVLVGVIVAVSACAAAWFGCWTAAASRIIAPASRRWRAGRFEPCPKVMITPCDPECETAYIIDSWRRAVNMDL